MSHQTCVTSYFSRKRKRDVVKLPKQRKVASDIFSKSDPAVKTLASVKSNGLVKVSKPTIDVNVELTGEKQAETVEKKTHLKNELPTTKQKLQISEVISPISNSDWSPKVSKDLPSEIFTKSCEVLSSPKPTNNVKSSQNRLVKISISCKDLQTSELKSVNEAKTKAIKNVDKAKPVYAFSSSPTWVCKHRRLGLNISKGLILPLKFKVLKEMFLNLDTVVSVLFNRQETVTWEKVKNSEQEMMKKNFELAHLAQIKTVYPEAYQLQQETNIVSFAEPSKRSKFELTLLPEFEESRSRLDWKMTGSILVHRRHQFHINLLDIVKDHHQKFLQKLSLPILANYDELRQWHPEFELDLVPDIPAAELPSSPHQSRLQCTSAQEVFEKSKVTKKAAEALQKVILTNHRSSTSLNDSNNNSGNSPDSQCSPKLKGVSLSLLTKIRKKEAEQNSRIMLRTEEEWEKLDYLRRLAVVARAMHSLFINEKKSSLPLNYISMKLSKSCSLIPTTDSMSKHVHLLAQHVPSWFILTRVRGQDYGRIKNKDFPIGDVIKDLQTCLKRAEHT